jgi:hypothetical protein
MHMYAPSVGFHETFWVISGAAAPVIALAAVVSFSDLRDQEHDFSQAWSEFRSQLRSALPAINQLKERAVKAKERAARDKERAARDKERAARDKERAARDKERAARDKERAARAGASLANILLSLPDMILKRLVNLGPKNQEEDQEEDPKNQEEDYGPSGIDLDKFDNAEKVIEKLIGDEKHFERDEAAFKSLAGWVQRVQLTNLIVQAALLCVSLLSVTYQFNLSTRGGRCRCRCGRHSVLGGRRLLANLRKGPYQESSRKQ